MTVRSQLRTLLLCIPLAMGSLMGVSMRAEELEELMSLATLETREQGFLSRFERLRSSLRRYQIVVGLAWSSLAADE